MASLVGSLLIGACSVIGVRSGTEEPRFTVVERLGTVEIRRYDARMAAETTVEGSPHAARGEGFGRLAGYIFGGSAEKARIAMTAPVAQAPEAGRSSIRFFLPSDLADPPRPNDSRVRIVPVPAETVAVLRYTGSTSDDAMAEQARALLAALQGTRWQAAGAPAAWFYDPPWTLPPLRRNEAAVAVTERG